MAAPFNHEQQPIRVASPQENLSPLSRDRDLPPNPPQSRSEAELTTQAATSEFPSTTNPTTLASPTTQTKSVPNSLYDPPHFPVPGRKASTNILEHDRAVGRYPSIARPRAVLAQDSSNIPHQSRLQSGLEWIVPNAAEKTVSLLLVSTGF